MAFDAGMTAAVCAELSETLVGAKIEKIYQPSADEIVLLCRGRGGSRKLLLSASASSGISSTGSSAGSSAGTAMAGAASGSESL